MTDAKCAILLLLLCLGLAVQSGGAERFSLNGVAVPLQGFRTNGVFLLRPLDGKDGAKEEVAWEMHGRRAILQLPEFHLTDFRMALQSPSRGEYALASPGCIFDQQSRSLHSDAPVAISGGGLKLEGVGYDVYLDEAARNIRIVVRQTVHLTVRMQRVSEGGKKNARIAR